MWAVFAALTFTVTAINVPHGPNNYGEVIWATIGTLAGPMPGALSRGSICRVGWEPKHNPIDNASLIAAQLNAKSVAKQLAAPGLGRARRCRWKPIDAVLPTPFPQT